MAEVPTEDPLDFETAQRLYQSTMKDYNAAVPAMKSDDINKLLSSLGDGDSRESYKWFSEQRTGWSYQDAELLRGRDSSPWRGERGGQDEDDVDSVSDRLTDVCGHLKDLEANVATIDDGIVDVREGQAILRTQLKMVLETLALLGAQVKALSTRIDQIQVALPITSGWAGTDRKENIGPVPDEGRHN